MRVVLIDREASQSLHLRDFLRGNPEIIAKKSCADNLRDFDFGAKISRRSRHVLRHPFFHFQNEQSLLLVFNNNNNNNSDGFNG
jgi:hypothetical protein